MKHYRYLMIVGLIGFTGLACSLASLFPRNSQAPLPSEAVETAAPASIPTSLPTADPILATVNCLANTWEITGLSDYVIAAVPPEMAEQYALQYQGTNGRAYFTLTPDGRIILQANQLELLFEARVSVLNVPVTVSVDGEAAGSYTLDGSTLTTTDMDTSGLAVSAQALGSDLLPPAQIINAIPLLQAPFNTAEYSCTGDTLQLKIAAYPESVPPLVFHKVSN